MGQKGFSPIILVVVLAVLVLIAGGAYFITANSAKKPVVTPVPTVNPQTTAPKVISFPLIKLPSQASSSATPVASTSTNLIDISNWKTFTNNQYTFKYPSNWTLFDKSGQSLYDQPNLSSPVPERSIIVVSVVQVNSSIPDINEPIGTRKQEGPSISSEKAQDLTVGNLKAAKYRKDFIPGSPGVDSVPNYTVYVPLPNQQILLVILYNLQDQNIQIFDSILSTFKFTNP